MLGFPDRDLGSIEQNRAELGWDKQLCKLVGIDLKKLPPLADMDDTILGVSPPHLARWRAPLKFLCKPMCVYRVYTL